jgi:hypothetical protein
LLRAHIESNASRELTLTDLQNFTALLGQLQHATGPELRDIIEEILKNPRSLDQVAKLVEAKVDAGIYVPDDPLASLISRSHSSSLYGKVRERLFKNDWALLKLYKGQYPDPEIENALCSRLYAVASNDGEPRRRYIVDAMKEVGSEAALPTLEAILFNLEPSAEIRQVFADALGSIGGLEASSRADFVRHVALAIDDIKTRSRFAPETALSNTKAENAPKQIDEANDARRYQQRAQTWLDTDPEIAIVYVRKGAEAVAKDLYRRLGCEQNGKPARKMTLDDLLKPIQDSAAPDVFKIILRTFQAFGNFASHDQGDQSLHLTKEIASALLALYDQALVIYASWSKGSV